VRTVISAENPEFVLKAGCLHPVHVHEVRREPVIRRQVLIDFETNLSRIGVTLGNVVHRDRPVSRRRIFRGQCRKKIGRESGYTALARNIVTNQGDFLHS